MFGDGSEIGIGARISCGRWLILQHALSLRLRWLYIELVEKLPQIHVNGLRGVGSRDDVM